MEINIPQRLKDLRKEHSFTAAKVSNGIGMKIGSYLAYEEGRAFPPIPTLINLCVFYGKTFDELLGVVNKRNEQEKIVAAYYCSDTEKRKIVDFILNLNC